MGIRNVSFVQPLNLTGGYHLALSEPDVALSVAPRYRTNKFVSPFTCILGADTQPCRQ